MHSDSTSEVGVWFTAPIRQIKRQKIHNWLVYVGLFLRTVKLFSNDEISRQLN
jgi:hypothetical protein